MLTNSNDRLIKLTNAIAHRRGQVLSILESEVGHTPEWRSLRARLLGVFGENGLTRDVKKIMSDEIVKQGGGGHV